MITKDEIMPGIKTSLKTALHRVFQPNDTCIKDLDDIVSEELLYIISEDEGEFICGVFTGVKIAARFFYGELLKNPGGIIGMIVNGYKD